MKLYYVDCIVLILINLISCLSADDRFATSHRLSWKEFAQRTPLKHCEQLEDAWLKRYQDKDYVQENTVATFQKDLHRKKLYIVYLFSIFPFLLRRV